MIAELSENMGKAMVGIKEQEIKLLMAEKLSNDNKRYFATLPITVRRNAFGRQMSSFFIRGEVKGVGVVPMPFIRAPYIEKVGLGAVILARVEEYIVAVRYQNQLAVSFHSEVTEGLSMHQYFIRIMKNAVV